VEEVKNNDSIKTNPVSFIKPATASFLLKSKKTDVGFLLNTKKWNFEKSTDKDSEYSFSLYSHHSRQLKVSLDCKSILVTFHIISFSLHEDGN